MHAAAQVGGDSGDELVQLIFRPTVSLRDIKSGKRLHLPLQEVRWVPARRQDYYPINSASSYFYLSGFEQNVIKWQLPCGASWFYRMLRFCDAFVKSLI